MCFGSRAVHCGYCIAVYKRVKLQRLRYVGPGQPIALPALLLVVYHIILAKPHLQP